MPNTLLTRILEDSRPSEFYSDEQLNKVKESVESDSLKDELLSLRNDIIYNSFGVEILMSKCSGLINSLLEKRDELKSLEVLLLNQSLSRILRAKSKENDSKIEVIEDANKDFIYRNISSNSELKFENNKILAEESSINNLSHLKDAFLNLKQEYKTSIDEINNTFDEFSQKEDSGLNYLDRYIEKKEIYRFLFKELFKYLVSLEEGFKTVYNINTNLPDIHSSNLLNDFHSWFRNNLLELEKITQYEQEFDLIISLNRGVYDKNGKIAAFNIANFAQQRDSGLIDFRLPRELLNKRNTRLRGISMATIFVDSNQWYVNEIFSFKVKLPNQIDSRGRTIAVPHLNINAPHYFKLSKDFQAIGNFFINIDPFAEDSWQITIPSRGSLYSEATIANYNITDIILILKIAFTD